MDIGSRLVHRAYVLVEANVPAVEAIEDLVTLANGHVGHLREARTRAELVSGSQADSTTLELAGFEPDLGEVAGRNRAALGDLLDRAIASFS